MKNLSGLFTMSISNISISDLFVSTNFAQKRCKNNFLMKNSNCISTPLIVSFIIPIVFLFYSQQAQAQIDCGVINTLYQTEGQSGIARVLRYNPFIQEYVQISTLKNVSGVDVDGGTSSNSAYNAITQKVYSRLSGSTITIYNPTNDFTEEATITLNNLATGLNQTLFAQDEFIGRVNGNSLLKIDITGLTFDATNNVTMDAATDPRIQEINITNTNPGSTPAINQANDYSLLGNFIYGISGTSLNIINANTGDGVTRPLNLIGSVGSPSGSYGASWQDRDGNFYTFNNGNGNIYRISDIETQVAVTNSVTAIDLVRVLLASPSGLNDGFGCEIQPNPLDWDGDGIDDLVDLDDDNDGILDSTEFLGLADPFGDSDGDNTPNFNDPDTPDYLDNDSNGVNDKYDVDGDGIPNAYDLDSDNDGITDNIEGQSTSGYLAPSGTVDSNGIDTAYGDGLDAAEVINTNESFINSDIIPDYLDNDSDNDGESDTSEAFGNIITSGNDIDFDGIDDIFDNQSGGPTAIGAAQNGTTPSSLPDDDNDLGSGGDVNYRDILDSDGDNVVDDIDADDDNDGILDIIEYNGAGDPFGDEDGDGLVNYIDNSDNGSSGDGSTTNYTDTNSDGIPDIFDTDGDGRPNHLDLDSDDDGIIDTVEAQNANTFMTPGSVDPATGIPAIGLDTDGITPITSDSDLLPDYLDIDSDDDGISDAIEYGVDTSAIDFTVDSDSDSIPDVMDVSSGGTDANNNGIIDNFETADTDGDLVPNYIDLDSDNDGIFDVVEAGFGANDTNNDGRVSSIPSIDVNGNGQVDAFEGSTPPNTVNGTPANYINTDSDDDGCADALEAAGVSILISLDADDRLIGMVGSNGLPDSAPSTGIPTMPAVTDSSDTTVCDSFTDSDNDRIRDGVDLDDDNDGIPDDEECGATSTPSLFTNGDFGVANTASDTFFNGMGNGSGNPDNYNTYVKPMPAGISTTYGYQAPRPSDGNYAIVTNSIGFSYLSSQSIPNFWLDFEDLTDDATGELGYFALFNAAGGTDIFFEQTVSGLSVGEKYKFTSGIINLFNPGYLDNGTEQFLGNTPIPPNVSMIITDTGGTVIAQFDSGDIINDGTWKEISLRFTATTTNMVLTIRNNTPGGVGNDFGIDNASLKILCDFDGDGIPNSLDLDSDNDGIPDIIEAGGTDTDGDGQIDYPTPGDPTSMNDTNNDGLDDEFAVSPLPGTDSDNDGLVDRLDLDSDNDGITDIVEAGGTDANADGQVDYATAGDPMTMADVDQDGFIDTIDTDDNFIVGVADGGTALPDTDTDGDTFPNRLDLDSDNDGIHDVVESGGIDSDGSGTADDDDNNFNNTASNGIPTSAAGGNTPTDTGADASPDYLNLDSDEDGCSDANEAYISASADGGDGGQFGIGTPAATGVFGLVTAAGYNNGVVATVTDATDATACDTLDSDGDGVLDDQEVVDNTDPTDPCDYVITNITEPQTGDWLIADCDGDGVTNGQEITDGTNPEDPCDFDTASITIAQSGDYLIADCDGDGVTNGTEITDGTNPNDPCDFVDTSITLDQTGDWLTTDCDGDTIPNGQEITDGTDPYDPCSSIGGTPPANANCDTTISIESDLVNPGLNNGVFQINNIELYPNHTVRIYNRWGILVFESQRYDNGSNAFRGISNGRTTVQMDKELPVGVYFYIIEYVENGLTNTIDGYLYVNR